MDICGYEITQKQKFFFIAGPCVIETRDTTLKTAEKLKDIADRLDLFLIFKSSYDKANRSSISSFRGPGLDEGLRIMADVKEQFCVPVTTDVHSVDEVASASDLVDLLQIPAFLCRQSDLITTAGKSGKSVNIKKGQFVAPKDVSNIIKKLTHSGCGSYSVTERGYAFGYNNLVVDMRSFQIIRSLGVPVVFDATHSTQLPGGGAVSGGQREFIPLLARSAVAAGVDGLFMEVHPYPEKALCDSSNQYYLNSVEELLKILIDIDYIVKERVF